MWWMRKGQSTSELTLVELFFISLMIEAGGLVQTPAFTVLTGSVSVSGQGTASSRLDVTDLLTGVFLTPPASIFGRGGRDQRWRDGRGAASRLGDPDGISSATLTISGVGGNGQASLLNVAGAVRDIPCRGAPETLLEVTDGGMLSSGPASMMIRLARIADWKSADPRQEWILARRLGLRQPSF